MSPRRALALVHVPWERPGMIADALAVAGVAVETRIVVDDPDPQLPDPRDLAALVVMGGPMGALDDAEHPGLAGERRLLAAAVEAGVPVLGVCLGMQLLAVALGAALHQGHATEIGFAPLEVLADDPVLGPLGERPVVLHWHGDTVDLPADATLLARTGPTPVQAFRSGTSLGLQFHLEVDAPLLAQWLAAPPMAADLVAHGISDLPRQAATHLPVLEPGARAALAAFAAGAATRA